MKESLDAQGCNGPVLLTGASTAVGRILVHLSRKAGLDAIDLTRREAAAKRTAELVPGVRLFPYAHDGWFKAHESETLGNPFALIAISVYCQLRAELEQMIGAGYSI